MLMPGTTTNDYRIAPGGEGPLAFEWRDKPHRLIYDLCGEIEDNQQRLAKLLQESTDDREALVASIRAIAEAGHPVYIPDKQKHLLG